MTAATNMKPTALPRDAKAKPKTLVQSQVDFTAEGAPPPGKVSTEPPQTPDKPARTVLRLPTAVNVPGARKGPPQRWPR